MSTAFFSVRLVLMQPHVDEREKAQALVRALIDDSVPDDVLSPATQGRRGGRAVHGANAATRAAYLARAYELGRHFGDPSGAADMSESTRR
jgi:hypothetical protein